VRQGDVDDCSICLSLIVLTEQPDLIRDIFTEPVENDFGAVDVNFDWIDKGKSIIVDSRVRFKNSSPNFVRAVADSGWFRSAKKAVTKAADPDSRCSAGTSASAA
jgi:hypothetical protein